MKSRIFWAGVALTLSLTGLFVVDGLIRNDGNLVYPVDDTFIHMAIAKNFALDGVWGATPYHFTSSTSSPLYTFLLAACIYIFGNAIAIPLVLNVIFGLLLLWVIYKYAQKNWDDLTYGVVNVLVILLTPLHIMLLAGMEHTLHILLMITTIVVAGGIISGETSKSRWWLLPLLAFVLMTVRYESIFFLTLLAVVLCFERKILLGVVTLVAAFAPFVLYGLISVSHGSFFLPNSLLIKATIPGLSIAGIIEIVRRAYHMFYLETPHIAFLVVLLIASIYTKPRIIWWPVVISIAAISHLIFAKTGWFFRYEAYLIATGIFVMAPLFPFLWNKLTSSNWYGRGVLGALLLLAAIPFGHRTLASFAGADRASNNIYEQQVQMARFIQEYYNDSNIAANDIGAITYYTRAHLLDFAGLGSDELVRNREMPMGEFMRSFAAKNDVQMIVIYDVVFKDAIPAEWIKVGEWTIQNNRICASETVSFYAIDKAKAETLGSNLKSFSSSKLDKDVIAVIP